MMSHPNLTGDLKLIADEVTAWAPQHGQIVRLWFFGSRARHADSPDIDLDIAFEIDELLSFEARATFQLLRGVWTGELSDATGLDIQLEPIAVEQIQDAVTDHGILIYERAGAPPCHWLP